MAEAVLGLDLGTSSCKALVLSGRGEVVATASRSYPTSTPGPGLVEQDPEDWWQAAVGAIRECLAHCPQGTSLRGLGLSGHMSVLLPLDEQRRPLRRALTIGDSRGGEEAQELDQGVVAELTRATGNVALSAFTLPKLLWYRRHEPQLYDRTVTVVGAKDYLRMRLTGELTSEPTDAGNTLLVDYGSRSWNSGLIDSLDLPANLFPPLRESLEPTGAVTPAAARLTGLSEGLPVISGLADMAASTLGSGLLDPDRCAITLGTSGQITRVVSGPQPGLQGRFTYHLHAIPGLTYTMASLFTGGLGLQWLSGILEHAGGTGQDAAVDRVLALAATSEPGARGLLFLPYLTGSGSPDFDPARRGSLLNLSLAHGSADIARAVLEGVGYTVRQCLELLVDHHGEVGELRVGGGGFRSRLWREIAADVVQQPVRPLVRNEAGALGVAIATAHGVGLLPDLDQWTDRVVRLAPPIAPNPGTASAYDNGYTAFLSAYLHSTHGGEES